MGGSDASGAGLALAHDLGRLVAAEGAVLLCGGRGGIMEAACRGAREAGGRTLGILPGPPGSGANPHVGCAVFTGLADARNYVNARLSDAVVALEGGAGTLSEIGLALKVGRPVVLAGFWRFLVAAGPFDDVPCADTAAAIAAEVFARVPRDDSGRTSRALDYPTFASQESQAAQVEAYVT